MHTDDLHDLAEQHDLSATETLVLMAIEYLTREHPGRTADLSHRTIAERARVGKNKIGQTLARFGNLGLVSRNRDNTITLSGHVLVSGSRNRDMSLNRDNSRNRDASRKGDDSRNRDTDLGTTPERGTPEEGHVLVSGDAAPENRRAVLSVERMYEIEARTRKIDPPIDDEISACIGTHAGGHARNNIIPISDPEDPQGDLLSKNTLSEESLPDLDLLENLSSNSGSSTSSPDSPPGDLTALGEQGDPPFSPVPYEALPDELEMQWVEKVARVMPHLEGLAPPRGFTWEQVYYVSSEDKSPEAIREKAEKILTLGWDFVWACHVATHWTRATMLYLFADDAPTASEVVRDMWREPYVGIGSITRGFRGPAPSARQAGELERRLVGSGPRLYRKYEEYRAGGGRLDLEDYIEREVMAGRRKPKMDDVLEYSLYQKDLEYRRGLVFQTVKKEGNWWNV